MRVYIDTSVVGGYYDEEFAESTKALFRKVEKGEFVLVVSECCKPNCFVHRNAFANT